MVKMTCISCENHGHLSRFGGNGQSTVVSYKQWISVVNWRNFHVKSTCFSSFLLLVTWAATYYISNGILIAYKNYNVIDCNSGLRRFVPSDVPPLWYSTESHLPCLRLESTTIILPIFIHRPTIPYKKWEIKQSFPNENFKKPNKKLVPKSLRKSTNGQSVIP